MSMHNLADLFLHHLKDTYDAEKRLTKALPKMMKAASSPALKGAFKDHLGVTEQHVHRLEQIFAMMDKPARGKKCVGIMGLIEEGEELVKEEPDEAVLDAGLIAAAQKVEHYEISAYGTMATYAEMLGMNDAVKLLQQTLGEEKETDSALTELATTINSEAEGVA